MRSFTLTLIDAGIAEPKRIDFHALEADHAFHILEREAVGQAAILWEGEKRLATLRRTTAGGWQINA
jgi:hypothetical protein